ncbi:MAG: NAD(P)H-hydrate dehydratase [Clostridia bacterium]|nr:NAD(P)H-hydrate dehydratase [Clostridia bacterium]
MLIVNNQEMAMLDRETINEIGLPGMVLMEHAALRVVELLGRLYGPLAKKRALIFAGKGNNGGDGLAIARLLLNAEASVNVFLLCNPEELKGDALKNFQILQQWGAKIHYLAAEKDLQRVDIALMCADFIVDAIYGTGFKGSVTGIGAELIKIINDSGVPVIAVDLPSGLDASTGKVAGPCIQASATVTLGLPKLGLLLEPGSKYVGELWLGEISLAPQAIKKAGLKTNLITAAEVAAKLPQRPRAAHKGTFGHVIAVGGSEGMTGAIHLAASGALRSGAGLVTAAVPKSLHSIMEMKTVEIMTKPLPETEAVTVGQEALDAILGLLAAGNVLLLGPGMSRHVSTSALLANLLPKVNKPLILDADALNMISADDPAKVFAGIKAPVIITPHPGEMGRLLGISAREVQQNRVETARQAAAEWKVVVVLKGAKTLVAHPDGTLYINPTGNPGMATGGSGDVLAGIIASLVAQGLDAFDAALVGVYVHGLAGDLAGQRRGRLGMTAGDLVEELPRALLELETGNCLPLPQVNERLRRIV